MIGSAAHPMEPNGAQAGTRTTCASFVPCRECRDEQLRCWRPVAEGGEWPHYIVMAPPSLDDNWAFEARFTVEQPVTKRGMENLDESVPHGACWCNVRYLGADSFDATLKTVLATNGGPLGSDGVRVYRLSRLHMDCRPRDQTRQLPHFVKHAVGTRRP